MAGPTFIQEFEDPDDEFAGSHSPWTEEYPAPKGLFTPFRRFETWASAELVKAFLKGEGVSSFLLPLDRTAALFGYTFTLFVESRHLHRARFVYEENEITERELTLLATGEFLGGEK